MEKPNETDETALKNTFEISENMELIRKFWEATYFERKKLLHELSTNEYLKKFPAFNLYNGYELVKYQFVCHVVRNCLCSTVFCLVLIRLYMCSSLSNFFPIYNSHETISFFIVCSLFWMPIRFWARDVHNWLSLLRKSTFMQTDKDVHRKNYDRFCKTTKHILKS